MIAGDLGRPRDRAAPACAAGSPEGEVALLGFAGERAEAKGIAALIQRLIRHEGVPAEEILVLLRGDYRGTFSGPIKQELENADIAHSDPDEAERMLAEPGNRRMLATFRLLVHDRDSLAWATLLSLAPGIGQAFCDYVYERARAAHVQFGEALFSAYIVDFAEAPRSAAKVGDVILAVVEWLVTHPIPDETPPQGWGHWMVAAAGGNVVPAPAVRASNCCTGSMP